MLAASLSVQLGVCPSGQFLAWGRRIRLFEGCFTSTETVGLLGTGAQDGHLDFHTAPELCGYDVVAGDIRVKKDRDIYCELIVQRGGSARPSLEPMVQVQCCLTSTETIFF